MPRLRYLIAVIGLLTLVPVVAGVIGNGALVAAGLAVLIAACTGTVLVATAGQHQALRRAEKDTTARLREIESIIVKERRTAAKARTALVADLLSNQQALDQLVARYRPEAPLPAVAGWAMEPAGLLWLTHHIETTRPKLVVECGSGSSTLWMAMALRAVGSGRLIALEHLPEYAERTRAVIDRHGLSDWVDVRVAPLRPTETPRGSFQWYGVDPADFDPIDLLIVDGPPGTTGPHARYPALPLLADRLAPGATIVADDIERRNEAEMLTFWLDGDPRLSRNAQVGRRVEVLTRS